MSPFGRSHMRRTVFGTAVIVSAVIALALLTSAAFAKPGTFYVIGTGANCTGPSDTSGSTFGHATANVKTGTVRVRLMGVSPNTTYNIEVWQAAGGSCFSFANGSVATND